MGSVALRPPTGTWDTASQLNFGQAKVNFGMGPEIYSEDILPVLARGWGSNKALFTLAMSEQKYLSVASAQPASNCLRTVIIHQGAARETSIHQVPVHLTVHLAVAIDKE